MYEIYTKDVTGLVKLDRISKDTWINVYDPSSDEINYLAENLRIPRDFITDPLDPDERSRIEIEDDVSLIIIRVPQRNYDNEDIPFVTIPVGIILTEYSIVTVCRNSDAVWDLLSRRILAKDFGFENRKSMVIRIFRKVVVLYLRFLKEINHRINLVEDLFHETMKNEDIIKLLNIEKSLVYFSASLKSNEIVLEKLLRIKIFQLDEEDKDEVEDIIIDNKQALEMSNIYGSILRDMMDAFSSVISNELNIVMKTLTALTIILMIPTLVSSFYGMNVRLPFQEHPHAFLITLLISVFLTVIGIIIFVKRKLF